MWISLRVREFLFLLSYLFLCIHCTGPNDKPRGPPAPKSHPRPSLIPEFSAYTIPIVKTPYHPYSLEFHMTRYYGGCYSQAQDQHHDNLIVPFIRNFQLLITTCGINWAAGNNGAGGTCVYKWDENDPMQIAHYQRFNITYNHKELKRIHVHSDRLHQKFFMDFILPLLETRAAITKERYIIHTGGGDSPPFPDYGAILQASLAVEKYIVEQNQFEEINAMSKVVLAPIGICSRENNFYGKELRVILHASSHANETLPVIPGNHSHHYHHHHHQNVSESQNRRLSHENSSTTPDQRYYMKRLLQAVQAAKSSPWENRLNKIFFCFSASYAKRKEVLTYIKSTEGLLEFCDHCEGELTHIDLWTKYTQYKFVFAPWGNGPDCFRNWEILLLGAIPVIQYFPGAYGYVNAGLSVILVRNNTELNRENLTKWTQEYTKPNPLEKLSGEYWTKYLFYS
jgi:hypothetical protein